MMIEKCKFSSEKEDTDVVSFSSLLVNGVDLLSPSMMVSFENIFTFEYLVERIKLKSTIF